MKLKNGYTLEWGETPNGATCGNGGNVPVTLMHNGRVVWDFLTCPCGRGCGGKDCVVDEWGYHDTELERYRAD